MPDSIRANQPGTYQTAETPIDIRVSYQGRNHGSDRRLMAHGTVRW